MIFIGDKPMRKNLRDDNVNDSVEAIGRNNKKCHIYAT